MKNPMIIGVSGGSGSGKSTFAIRLADSLGADLCNIISQDSFYLEESKIPQLASGKLNFDHPEAIDWEMLKDVLHSHLLGKDAVIPQYDFSTNSRLQNSISTSPKPYIILEGLLIFSQREIWNLCHYKTFVDVPEELRFQRRLERDIKERGRTEDSVREQFKSLVKPMHDLFVEPYKDMVDFIVDGAIHFREEKYLSPAVQFLKSSQLQ